MIRSAGCCAITMVVVVALMSCGGQRTFVSTFPEGTGRSYAACMSNVETRSSSPPKYTRDALVRALSSSGPTAVWTDQANIGSIAWNRRRGPPAHASCHGAPRVRPISRAIEDCVPQRFHLVD